LYAYELGRKGDDVIRTGGKLGLLLVSGVVAYVLVLMAQNHAAVNLCDSYATGSRIEDLEDLDGSFFLTRMGPFEIPENPGTQRVIFCATLTMCDTSCSLEIWDRVVVNARFSGL
jgi:hypothetical protein